MGNGTWFHLNTIRRFKHQMFSFAMEFFPSTTACFKSIGASVSLSRGQKNSTESLHVVINKDREPFIDVPWNRHSEQAIFFRLMHNLLAEEPGFGLKCS